MTRFDGIRRLALVVVLAGGVFGGVHATTCQPACPTPLPCPGCVAGDPNI